MARAKDDADTIVVIRQSNDSGWISGLLLGAVAGAVVGLLRAPSAGGQLRQQLISKARERTGRGQKEQTSEVESLPVQTQVRPTSSPTTGDTMTVSPSSRTSSSGTDVGG